MLKIGKEKDLAKNSISKLFDTESILSSELRKGYRKTFLAKRSSDILLKDFRTSETSAGIFEGSSRFFLQ